MHSRQALHRSRGLGDPYNLRLFSCMKLPVLNSHNPRMEELVGGIQWQKATAFQGGSCL